MTRFSEYLDMTIEKSGMTETQLAKMSGFTRSYIALMRSGKRISSDEQKMAKLMQALNLSPLEQERFAEEYLRSKLGDDVYQQTFAVLDFFGCFSDISNIPGVKRSFDYEIPNIKTINNRINLEQIIQMVIRKESMKEDGFIHIMMQSGNDFLGKTLSDVCGDNKNLKVDHIVCIENNINNDETNYQLYNIKLLNELTTTAVRANSTNYQVYYYYDHVVSLFNTGTLLSYMVLTSEYLICMDSDLNYGTLSADVEIKELYEQLFQQHKKKCKKMFLYLTDDAELINTQIPTKRKDSITYSLAQQPCLGMHKTEWLIDKYFLDNNGPSAAMYEKKIRYNRENLNKPDQKHVAYCSKEGLRRFVEDGVVDEIPRNFYTAPSLQDRKKTLEILLQSIDEGHYEMYLIDDIIQNIPKELFVNTYDIPNTFILYFSSEKNMLFIINEANIIRLVHNTLENLPKYLPSDSKKTSRDYLESLIKQL